MTQASLSAGVALELRRLSKHYGPREVLRHNTLRIEPGEFVAIVGRSGCGKSTLLRLVAGLETPTGGELLADGQPTQGLHDDTRIMFQDARLLPWKRVIDNVALGLPAARRADAEAVLSQVGLGDRLGDWPARLSGGQRQRVSLARALVHQPRLLLLDEPLGALDALTRIEMHALIEGLWKRRGFTALLVTHDVQEAVALADRVLLIEDGAIALDERIELPRPRSRGDAAFAAIEKRILDRVLQIPDAPAPDPAWPGVAAHGLRWAI
ncbi:ATP-binding cassette domain-containing protein [Acidovorax lacteus]|uniref:Aliphatic sulfonates ABC transporter ATP-binding protein n=1 Tax=Acidovorax lacteus TaxID=1924988 RepID=A0ABP8LD24_9BURK